VTFLIHSVRAPLQTINLGILTLDPLDPGARITPLEMPGVQLTQAPGPVMRMHR